MPDPVVDGPNPNPDGTTTTTTTTFHSNGSIKDVTTEIRDADDNLTQETVETRRRGGGAGDDGEVTRREQRKYDDEGRLDEETVTEFRRNGNRETEKTTTYDDAGRVDQRTETDFDRDGDPEQTTEEEFDDQGRQTRLERTRFGDRKAVRRVTTDYSARPPRQERVEEQYCPEPNADRVRTRETRVYYNRAGSWQEERRERQTERFNCETGERTSSTLPDNASEVALAILTLAAIAFSFAGSRSSSNELWLLAVLSMVGVAALYGRWERRKADSTYELLNLARSFYENDRVPRPRREPEAKESEPKPEESEPEEPKG
jgi:hypothetical protein